MEDRYQIAMGFKGRLDDLGVASLKDYQAKDSQIRAEELPGHPLFTPIIESNPLLAPNIIHLTNGMDITDAVATEYAKLCDPRQTSPEEFVPGPFGDFIEVIELDRWSYMMKVSSKAFHKPGLAADLAVVVKGMDIETGQTNYHLVTGVRKADPGKGQPAWLGGFTNVGPGPDGIYVFDSSAYTLLHEAVEEAGLYIGHDDPEALRQDYTADNIPVTVRLGKLDGTSDLIETHDTLHYLYEIPTSDLPLCAGGEALPNGEKRVYATTGYLLCIGLEDMPIDEDTLSNILTPGDDIGALQFYDITDAVHSGKVEDLPKNLKFGIEHHSHFLEPLLDTMYEIEFCAPSDRE